MRRFRRLQRGFAVGMAVSMMFALGASVFVFSAPVASAQPGPTRVSGGGQAIAGSVTYTLAPGPCGAAGVVHSGIGPGSGALFSSTGHRITFGLSAIKDSAGNVRGRMQLVDHTIGLTIQSDVAVLTVNHPTCGAPVGLAGPTALMISSTAPGSGVIVNGVFQPGWRLVNSPAFDGGEGQGSADTVCFEVFNAANQKVRQWSAFLSSGNVQIVP